MYLRDDLEEVIQEDRCARPAAAPFTLEHLAEWLEGKERGKTYCYESNGNCLIAQYFRENGRKFRGVAGHYWRDYDGNRHDLPDYLNAVAVREPRTFGAALERTRAALSSRPKAGSPNISSREK